MEAISILLNTSFIHVDKSKLNSTSYPNWIHQFGQNENELRLFE